MNMPTKSYWVYMLFCENGTYYTGYTNDLDKRYKSHLDGTGRCKYTRSFKPLGIAQCWQVNGSKSLAMQLERAIKKLSRAEKKMLITDPISLSTHSSVCPVSKEKLLKISSKALMGANTIRAK